MSAKTAAKRPMRSGFCNPAWDEASHARCRMPGCCCECHDKDVVEAIDRALDGLIPEILGSDAARAVGKFQPDGPSGYVAKSGGPLRETRAEAERDEILERVAQRIASRIYRCGWDQLPESDRHSVRVLAQQEIDDVRAAEETP